MIEQIMLVIFLGAMSVFILVAAYVMVKGIND